jgi:uncharacterized protein YjbI with pentapeptide repeats
MPPKELKKILESHHLWLSSDGKDGERANFERADLRDADLQKAMLNKAEFKNANLIGANLQGAQLRGASFDGAELSWADLRNASLDEAGFKKASLPEANLQGAKLPGASFDGTELQYADLRNAILNEAGFKTAFLTGTNFQGAQLRRASFDGADLRGANLREADLQNANLENANYLLSSQLAGADVAGAKLPSAIAEFKGLETIAEATSNAQKLLVAMLGGCLYSWLTIGTTKDAALLTNSASSPLPIIGTALPIVGFYMVAPIVLLAIYFYFHLNMQRLWEGLADLPAVFPDGRSLDKRADPWLLNGLVSAHFVRLRPERPPLSRVQQWLSILLAWWVVPATLFVFWGRFLARHDWLGTTLHIGLLAAATSFGWMSYRLARATLRGAPRIPFPWRLSWVYRRKSWRRVWKDRRRHWRQLWEDRRTFRRVAGIFGTFVIGFTLYYVSLGAIEGVPSDADDEDPNHLRKLVPRVLRHVGFSAFANLVEADISTKPASWTGRKEEYPLVKGARLLRTKAQYADARSAFLMNADLSFANLVGADLSEAILSHAILKGSYLSKSTLIETDLSDASLAGADLSEAFANVADFSNANLEFTNLSGAKLANAKLRNARLDHAKLTDANLLGADLSNSTLLETDFSGAWLERAILRSTDLTHVQGLTKSQIQMAVTDDKTLLPANLPP